jgi:hypothetical protein
VTPSPRSGSVSDDDEESIFHDALEADTFPSSDLEHLCKILGVSHSEAISDLIIQLGCTAAEDLALITTEDLEATSLSPMTQRKLLLVVNHITGGGGLRDVASVRELVAGEESAANKPSCNKSDENIIDLNVGGYKFTTSRETLCRVPGSLFEALLSGRHDFPARQNQDGAYFIDRDGKHFHHILNFLRVGGNVVNPLPLTPAEREELAVESDYYGLEGLVRAIRCPKKDISSCLGEEVLSIRRKEDEIRQAFKAHESASIDPHEGLVPLFCPDHGIQPLPLTYEPDMANEMLDGHVFMGELRPKAEKGVPTTVSSLEGFQSNFNREHPNVLHRLQDVLLQEPVIIAGGSVLQALTSSDRIRTEVWWGSKSDVDIFVHTKDPHEATRIARRIWYALSVDHEQWVIVRARGVITMHSWIQEVMGEKIQVVLRLYESPVEVLLGFDCDCCCCAYDGSTVWITQRCLHALRSGLNILNPLHAWPNKPSYEFRLAKYAYRGFSVAVPGLDQKRVDYEGIRRMNLRKLKGLARLLKISFKMEDFRVESNGCPQQPRYVPILRDHVKGDLPPDEKLVDGANDFYDDFPDTIIVPSVYGDGEREVSHWFDYVGDSSTFPPAGAIRDEAWEEIASAGGNLSDGSPPRLTESWDPEKRSREYINANMDTFDLDNIYYDHAYEPSSDESSSE